MLSNKGLVIIPMAIIGITMFGNTVYADSIEATKDRIKEIKIVEEIDINKLVRNKIAKVEQTYERQQQVTSRSQTSRESTKNTEKIIYKKIEDLKINKNMNLTVRTGLSKEDFKKVIKNLKQDTSKFFYNNSDTIYDLCEKYQINEIFFCGLISAESGWNIASNHRSTHNYISLMSNGKLIHYSSVEEGLEVAAKKLYVNYLTPGGKFYGGKTLSGVKKKFCPSATWVDLVYGRMSQMMVAVNKCK